MHGNIGKKQTKDHKSKINTPERAYKISETLKRLYREGKKVSWTKGKKLSSEHKEKIRNAQKKGNRHHKWKGQSASYFALHQWLAKYYGKAYQCENRDKKIRMFPCSEKTNIFEWSKKKSRRYSRKKEDYMQLCRSCHRIYDFVSKSRICDVKRCKRKHSRHGFCTKHACRYEKHGHPLAVREHDNPIKYID